MTRNRKQFKPERRVFSVLSNFSGTRFRSDPENMDSEQRFLERFGPSSEAEWAWLKNIFLFIGRYLSPCCSDPAPSTAEGSLTGVEQLSIRLVLEIQQRSSVDHSLPVSYRLLSVSELVSQQNLACVSNLSWTTNQHRAWAKEAELSLPGQQTLQRVNLLLIGCLTKGRGGDWRLTDSSGSVRCELLSPSPLWMNLPVFLPDWNYIPHDASGQDVDRGHLELIGSPVFLGPEAEHGLAAAADGAELEAVPVSEAGVFLQNRVIGQRVSVHGQVCSVCPLLDVSGTPFFCFSLTDGESSLPVLVQEPSRLWWRTCVHVGRSVCVTSLRVCVLRGWRGNNILCVTERSQLHADYTNTQTHTPDTHPETDTPLLMSHDCEEEEPDVNQSGVRMKRSRIISYQGTVTEVVSEGAGLYVLDRKLGLCVAYQPASRRSLRVGDGVELHHVHFLFRPCPDFPPSMLCTCLRSSVTVTSFSRVGVSDSAPRCPGDGVLSRLLLQKHKGVSEYLWACHLSSQLSISLVPAVMKQQCVCLLSWKMMKTLRGRRAPTRRDIYCEMLDQPHTCPLSQYSVDPVVHQNLSVLDLVRSLLSLCWSSLSLRSLLPPAGRSLSRSEIRSGLSWSFRTLVSDPQKGDSLRPRPLLLVGVLELPPHSSKFSPTLHLRDATGSVGCVVTETSREEGGGGETACYNTAWIGCLVCVLQFSMVTERFLQSEFPSVDHLDQENFITFRDSRVYLQFSLDHLLILSPSVTMVTYLKHKGEEPGDDVTDEHEDHPKEEQRWKRKRREGNEDSSDSSSSDVMTAVSVGGASQSCVSMVIRVEQKGGLVWKNTEGAELQLCFSLRAAVIGPVVSWRRDPKNKPLTEEEVEPGREHKVQLQFSGVCSRWFPVLQSGRLYRVLMVQVPFELSSHEASGNNRAEFLSDSTLQVGSDWRFHTLPRPLLLPSCLQATPPVLSVSQVMDNRSELVCFQGQISERISVDDGNTEPGNTGVRLTLCDPTGRSVRAYLDLSHAPYPPGLLPGSSVLLSDFQRKVSRSGGVYFTNLPVSSMTVMSLGAESLAPPPHPPMMHLGQWGVKGQKENVTGLVRGHVVCFLFLQLQWSCSTCSSVYTQVCSSQCGSSSAVFRSRAKLVIDDGTGEAHVWVSGVVVQTLLGLADFQWVGLQRWLKVKGHLRVLPGGRSLVSDSEEPLLHFLLSMCSSEAVRRPVCLTCRRHAPSRAPDLRRFSRADRDFITRMTPPLQLTCVHLH
ncbi:CST complex subunit CTC1, partial [Oryzias melastigma]|uniref:CST complex subunit CTC1 n=1 Tax=Oryzias melastigma TaxID=30732 RepID=UPI000CF7E1EA